MGKDVVENRLTIAYMTSRLNPRVRWFLDSLSMQAHDLDWFPPVIVVDRWHGERSLPLTAPFPVLHTPPKPCVWQGQYRLTSRDYFAASNARNTAVCLAPTPWIAFVDDLSVLMPGWLAAVQRAMAGNYIACGAYRKVRELVVVSGLVRSYMNHPTGHDHRWAHGKDEPVGCGGCWFFGCSLALPTEALLAVNGWPEECDSLAAEDYIAGLAIERNGYRLCYDRRMLTWESEEAHYEPPVMCRLDKGQSPSDKSHAVLVRYKDARAFPQPFGSLRDLRQRILAGEPFPIPTQPSHDWYDGQPLSEM